jgi:hypothetical protein
VLYRVRCVTVPTHKGVRLTCGVREALGPAWQYPEEEDDAGRLHALDWAGVIVELGRPRRKWPTMNFFQFKLFFQLSKSAGENKNRRNTWGPQKNVKFCMEIDLNIFHNFSIENFDQWSTIFK